VVEHSQADILSGARYQKVEFAGNGMKKCIRCNIAFHSSERTRCLYCGAILFSESGGLLDDKPFDAFKGISDSLKAAGHAELDRKQYMVTSYFRSRTLRVIYAFYRNELRQGKTYRRFFVRPLDSSALLSLPWLFINLLDSLFFRMVYIGFCEKCQYKYQPQASIVGHESNECEYCQEYSAITKDIMSGKIGETEVTYKEKAEENIKQGRRSAYRDLCCQNTGADAFFDITGIWISVCLIIFVLVRLLTPPFIYIFKYIEKEGQQEEAEQKAD
jgi:hypothetical protein